MENPDIRWKQRFNNFRKALDRLGEAVDLARTRQLSELEQQGLIQAFEFTHELAWKTLKDLLQERGTTNLLGSKDVTREAFAADLIEDGETWMRMIETRNQSTHTYVEATAQTIAAAILDRYFAQFQRLQNRLEAL